MKFCESILTLQLQAPKCNFEGHLSIQLRDRLIDGVNHSEVHMKLLLKQDLALFKGPTICEQLDDDREATGELSVVHF